MNIHKNGKHWWFDFGWFDGSPFKVFGVELFEDTSGAKIDICIFHFQVFKFVIAFGRWS